MSLFSVKLNGEFITKVTGHRETTREEFVAFIRAFGRAVDEAKDIIEIECLDVPLTPPIAFKTNAYMQVDQFAIDCHIENLFATYGQDVVMATIEKLIKSKSAA